MEVEEELVKLMKKNQEFVAMCFDALTIGMSAKHPKYKLLQRLCKLVGDLR